MAKGSSTKAQAAKANARRLFVDEGITIALIAEQLGKSESSIRKYKAADEKAGVSWDKARVAKIASTTGSDDMFRACVVGIVDSISTTLESIKADVELKPAAKASLLAGLADSLRKTISSAKAYSPDVALEVVAGEVLEIVATELTKRNPEAAQVMVESLDQIKAEIFKRQKSWQN